MSQAGILDVINSNPGIPIIFDADTGFATAIFNILNIKGTAAQGVSTSATLNTVTITVANATTASKGVAQFNPADFSVSGGVVSLTGSGFVLSVSGTANRITSSGGQNPVIDISAAYVGQSSITTLGTVTTGTWNAIAIGPTFGGTGQTTYATGDILYASAANTLSKLAAGSNTQVLTLAAGIPSWATPTTGTVTSVSGTLNRITSSGGNTPVIDISASYVGQSSITTLGTITTGVWNGTAVDATHGGTGQTVYAVGDILYASTTTALSKLAATTNGFVLTLAAGIPSWAAAAAGTVTSVSGTTNRITSTGGATPVIDISASYVGQSSITTLGTVTTGTWNASVIGLAYGGTNANLTASNGGIFYSTASAGAILAGTTTANQILQSGASAAPTWSTATYPSTTTINRILYSSSTNVVAGLATANNGVLTTGTSGIPVITPLTADGQIIIGSASGAPTAANIVGTGGVTVTNAANSITISVSSSGFSWTDVTGATQTIAAENGYITDRAGGVTYTLPASGALGDTFKIVGKAGIATITPLALQQLLIGSASGTVGITGTAVSTNAGDCIEFVCITSGASTVWRAANYVGNWTLS